MIVRTLTPVVVAMLALSLRRGQAHASSPLAPLTPVEAFAPHYSYALGAYILAQHKLRQRQGGR
jgi:hypothetical protein